MTQPAHEEPTATAARLGCSLAYVALHNRNHRCLDGAVITRPPCLFTDPSRHNEALIWMHHASFTELPAGLTSPGPAGQPQETP